MPPGKTARHLQYRKCPQIGYLPFIKMNISKKIRDPDSDTLMLVFLPCRNCRIPLKWLF